MIRKITVEELKEIDKEGLVLQGCGGPVEDWINGINDMFTKEGILLGDTKFENVSVFEHEGFTQLLFDMSEAKIQIGKLAMWRLATHEQFGGKWLSDYLPQNFGVEMKTKDQEAPEEVEKPDCALIGADGNIYNLMGIASRTLKEHGLREEASEMIGRIHNSGNYHEALHIIGDYVNIVSVEDEMDMDEDYENDMEMGGM